MKKVYRTHYTFYKSTSTTDVYLASPEDGTPPALRKIYVEAWATRRRNDWRAPELDVEVTIEVPDEKEYDTSLLK